MKIRAVAGNNRKKVFEVTTSAKTLIFLYAKLDPQPTVHDPLREFLGTRN